MAYLPFQGLSAWFSCSVNPKVIRNWDLYGGTYAGETVADFLFSDDNVTKDTRRVYETQKGVVLFQSTWILEVVQRRCRAHDVAIGQHLLYPHFLTPTETSSLNQSHVTVTRLTSRNAKNVINHSTTDRVDHLKSLSSDHPKEGSGTVGQREGLKRGSTRQVASHSSSSLGDSERLWKKLEKKASKSKMAESVHIDQIQVSSKRVTLYEFDHAKPGFHVERIGVN